jgi:hypothetical protein
MNLADIPLEHPARVVKMMDHWLKSTVLGDNIHFKMLLLRGESLFLIFSISHGSVLLTPFFSGNEGISAPPPCDWNVSIL